MTHPQQNRPRVVLIDDHPRVLRALSRFLQDSCDVVATADSGEQGIEIVVCLAPDVVIVDLTMLDMDGLEVCRRIKQSAPQTDVIILTAFDDEQVKNAAFQAGASAFVAKHAAAGALQSIIQGLTKKKTGGGP